MRKKWRYTENKFRRTLKYIITYTMDISWDILFPFKITYMNFIIWKNTSDVKQMKAGIKSFLQNDLNRWVEKRLKGNWTNY